MYGPISIVKFFKNYMTSNGNSSDFLSFIHFCRIYQGAMYSTYIFNLCPFLLLNYRALLSICIFSTE